MELSWLSLVPPILVLVAAYSLRDVTKALILGIVTAAAVSTNGNLWKTILLSIQSVWNESNIPALFTGSGSYDHLLTFSFLILLGVIISCISHIGAASAYGAYLKTKIHSARSAQGASLLLSAFLAF